jgi:aerobic carbon-monoxide dehydrogenase medium subunit
VKAARFDYERPESLSEALALLQRANGSAKALAGGQSLVPMMNLGLVRPDMLVDLSGLGDLRRVQQERAHLFIGAMVTHAEIEDGRLPETTLGMLKHVAACIGSRGIRNRGTIGGNLAHGDPAADWPAALLALGAGVQLVGTTGRRTVPVSDFLRNPFTTALRPDELLEGVRVPRLSQHARWSYYRVRRGANASPDAIGAVVIDPARGFCRTVLSGSRQIPRDLPLLAGRLTDTDRADFASKFGLDLTKEALAQSGFGGDPIEAQIYVTVLLRTIKRAIEK